MQINQIWIKFDLKKKIYQKHFLFKKQAFLKSNILDWEASKLSKTLGKDFLNHRSLKPQKLDLKNFLFLNWAFKNKKCKKQVISLNFYHSNRPQFVFQKDKKKYWNLIKSF